MRVNPIRLLFLASVAALVTGCQKTVTYAEQKAHERETINEFIENQKIDVITLDEFLKDTITNNFETGPDTTRNEFVLFPETGVYMQIVRRGEGKVLQDGDRRVYNCRFMEHDIANDEVINLNLYENYPDVMTCTRTGDTYSATFVQGKMFSAYGTSVPSGWLVPMPYIRPSFYNGDQSSKVRLIVPHDHGNRNAMQSVFACYYEIVIMSQKWQ